MAESTFSQGYGPFIISGAPVAGTDEVQTIIKNSTVTAGTFRLSFEGFVTAEIAWDATTAGLETALNNLPSIGMGGTAAVGVAVTGGALPGTTMTITFSGTNVAKKAHGLLALHLNSLTGGGSMTIAESIAGVDATLRGKVLRGGILLRTDATANIYQQTGADPNVPTWTTR